MAVLTFVQQPADECGLGQQRREDGQNLQLVPVPDGRFAEINFAARRQAAFADAPALHFSPVEHRPRKLDRRHLDVARLLATKDANGNCGCLSASVSRQEKRTADNMAEEGFVIRKNRRICDGVQPWQRRDTFVHDTRRIDDHQLPEDGGLWRQRGGVF